MIKSKVNVVTSAQWKFKERKLLGLGEVRVRSLLKKVAFKEICKEGIRVATGGALEGDADSLDCHVEGWKGKRLWQ